MGADFCCATLPIPKVNGKMIDLDYDGAIKAINEVDWGNNEWANDYYGGDTEDVKAVLLDAVDRVREIVEGGMSREAGWIERPTEIILLTGGMSWGDSPTDLFDKLIDLASSGIDTILTRGGHVVDNVITIRVQP